MKQRQRRKQYDRSSSNGQKMAVAKSRLSAEPIDAGDQATLVASSGQNVDLSAPGRMPELAFAGLILAAAFVWAYWPTLVSLVDAVEPASPITRTDSSWHRWRSIFSGSGETVFPGLAAGLSWLGLGLVVLAVAARMFSAHYYLEAIDGWSIMLWVAGVAWLLAGWRVMWWSLPSIVFLWFMVPLPFPRGAVVESAVAGSGHEAELLGLAVPGAAGPGRGAHHLLGNNRLEVEQACSGLRIFVGILALAFAYVIVMRRAWWEKALLLASAIPIALLANASRIVATGLLYQYASGEAARKFRTTRRAG